MGNTEKNKSKKCRRKIRIRLVDPNIPDSYVCEIFDSSLENEDEISKIDKPLPEENEGSLKPQNYFELLMSKKCNTSNENNAIRLSDNGESLFKKRQTKQKKSKAFLAQSGDVKNEQIIIETDSSGDESPLQTQNKCKQKNFEPKPNTCAIQILEEECSKVEIKTKNDCTIFDSPKAELSLKKTFSILNYFSKTEISPKNKLQCKTLEEITAVRRNSLETCQASTLKLNKKHSSSETLEDKKKVSINTINKENVKLAPFFNKKEIKIIDDVRQKARLEFLYKGSPSIPKKSESKTSESISYFPKVVHIQQRNGSAFWSLRKVSLPLPHLPHSQESIFSNNKKFSLQIKRLNVINNAIVNHQISNGKEVLTKLRCKNLEFNLDLIIDSLKDKRDRYHAQAEEIKKSKSTTIQQPNDDKGFEELNALWTEKYKPKSCEILGNENVVKRLRKWLELWKSFDEELKVLAKSSRNFKGQKENNDDSDDDFIDSGCENFGLKAPRNVCIISGPNGCGKTALVYALANELEFGVLELNASSKRTGRRVLSDLQEATQSHKVHRVNLFQVDKVQKEVKNKKSKKRKKNKRVQEPSKILDQVSSSKISLILIEEAEIVFDEHDEGFYSAIASLAQTSKRPLIFLTNEPNCHRLYSIKREQCLILEMELPNFYKSCAILEIISSLEGGYFEKEFLESIVRRNNFDLRKSLLELQFWIHSNKKSVSQEEQFDLGRLWWGLSKFLFQQEINHFAKPKSLKRKRVSDLFDSSDDELEKATKKFKSNFKTSENCSSLKISETPRKSDPAIEFYYRVLDLTSNLDCFLTSKTQEPIPGLEFKPKDSLSLVENMEEVSWMRNNISEELSKEMLTLTERIFNRQLKETENSRKLNFASPSWEEIRWRNSREKASEELSTLISLQRGRDNRSLHLDYLPILRHICRLERNRSEMNPKRKNRFYHYLNNLGFELTDENLDINCDVFDG